ncbi:NAD-dependent epimerase/dehydratase family protein [Brevibacterium album]|uniref:NAD-dependent epimerase/dehydratase family protein n=1 Tax=Brevibacterium album TaxID=417948 RepID=UPI0004198BBA|nr:NAD-dependent epimerase/dehydratase family protein [Brevibacterium album]
MRVAVVGATGNVGTAVLEELARTPEVSSVLGIARRLPDTGALPYSGCEWASLDIAAASTEEAAVAGLREAFAGADAVIHLAWLIQPNDRRDLLRRVNVDGTARVARAAAEAGVPHLVAASSVGAYSPDGGTDLRDETWPTEGIRTSHYSVDKAAQEAVLDRVAASSPGMTVTRLRSALVFGGAPASEIQRYFLGAWMPVHLLRAGRLPALPLPRGLRGVQAVHREDAARAYVAAVLRRRGGAFNICAEDVLGAQDLGDVVDHGRTVELPTGLMRAGLALGHRTGAVAADPGWLDMAVGVPLMDAGRARGELGWAPRHSAREALQILLAGMAEGQGAPSGPLRPRTQEEEEEVHPAPGQSCDRGLLSLYLSDHLTGARAGEARIRRMAEAFADTPVGPALTQLADGIRADRAFAQRVAEDLGLRRRPARQALAWSAEHLGRLKANGRLLSRSPLTLLLETELMRSAVEGKLGLWQTCEDNAGVLGLDAAQFARRVRGTRAQLQTLDAVHRHARAGALRRDRDPFAPAADAVPVGTENGRA